MRYLMIQDLQYSLPAYNSKENKACKRFSVELCLLWLTDKNLVCLGLTVNFFPLQYPEILKISFHCLKNTFLKGLRDHSRMNSIKIYVIVGELSSVQPS